jgi:hypothetical protein
MRHPITSAGLLILSLAFTGTAKDKIYVTIRATSHTDEVRSTSGTTNCRTTSTPPRVRQVTRSIRDVSNIVEADNQRYLITCRASWADSNCTSMTHGDIFQAEIDGTTMWVHGRNGGNQGKEIRVKYEILDIRPAVNSQHEREAAQFEP